MDENNGEWQLQAAFLHPPGEGPIVPFKEEGSNAKDDFSDQYPALIWLKWIQMICSILMLLVWCFVLKT